MEDRFLSRHSRLGSRRLAAPHRPNQPGRRNGKKSRRRGEGGKVCDGRRVKSGAASALAGVQVTEDLSMIESEFQQRVWALGNVPFREDFQTAFYNLYVSISSAQRAALREKFKRGELLPPKTWRNPTDYQRSDLTREQRMRQNLIAMLIQDGSPD